MRPAWPLVGRQEELALINEALTQPEVRGVVLAGDPGVGKTRLAQETVEAARSAGFRAEWAAATHSSSEIPFGALAHLLPQDLLASDSSATTPRNVLAQASEALTARADAGSLVLGIDDAHLLDDASAALLYEMAEAEDAFVVAAIRSREPTPDAVTGLWKDGLAERVEVQPLSRGESDHLVEAALGGQVDAATLHRLFDTTRGNPLFLRELVLSELQAGELAASEGVWRWSGRVFPAPRLLDIIEQRLGRLDEADRGVLEIIAEAEDIGVDDLGDLVTLELVEALERRGLLESWAEGDRTRTRLAHPLYVEAIRARTSALRARTIRSRLADAAERRGSRRREDLLRIATWRLGSGSDVRPDLAIEASRQACLAGDHGLAERLALAAEAAGGGFQATHAVVDALVAQGRSAEADALLRPLEDASLASTDRAMAAMARATNLFWRLGDGDGASAVLERAEAAVSDLRLRDELAAARSTLLLFSGCTAEGLEAARGILDRGASDRALAQAVPAVWALNVTGRTEEARRFIERVHEPVERLTAEFPHAPVWLAINVNVAAFVEGRIDEAWAGLEAHYLRMTERGSWERTILPWALAWIAPPTGRLRIARRRLAEAILFLRDVDIFNHLPLCLAEAAHLDALLGDVEQAEAELAEAERVRLPVLQAGEGFFGLARIWVAAARGETSRAMEEAERTAEVARTLDHVVFEATALHDVARLGGAGRVVDSLDELAHRVNGGVIGSYARHARALAEADASGLIDASRTFESMGATLHAAEAAAEAAQIHRAVGRTGSALSASTRAATFTEACDGARTPALAGLDGSLPLTPREREVASLAAIGLTNQQVAERLVVSVRTVENHLHSVYGKLEIASREELGPILGVAPIASMPPAALPSAEA